MKQKMKKCLCLMLSFVFVLSNCTQLFAQTVPTVAEQQAIKAGATVPEELLAKATKDMETVKHSLKNLEFYANKVLKQSQFAKIEPYVLERYQKYLKEVEDLYTSVINRTVSYTKYLNQLGADLEGASETIIARASRQYSYKAPHLVVNNRVALEEGSAIRAIKEEIGKVIDLGPKGVNYAANTAKVEKDIMSIFDFLDKHIEYCDHMLKGTVKGQEVLTEGIDKLIAEGVIKREHVINYVVNNMRPEEFRLVKVLKEAKAGTISRLAMARELRKYLTAIGSKKAKAPMIGVMRHISYKTLKSNLSPKTQKFIKDFPELLEEGGIPVAKKGMNIGPVAVVGALLTVGLITEVRSDNSFGIETVSNKELVNLQRSIENNTAGEADMVMFYSNAQSDRLTNTDTKHFIRAITLAMNLEEAENNFDIIDNILSEEGKGLSYNVDEELQNKLESELSNISDKVAKDIGVL